MPYEFDVRKRIGLKPITDWRDVAEFDFTEYSQDELRQCNYDFSDFLKEGLLRCSVDVMPNSEARVKLSDKFTEDYYSHFGEHMHSVNLYYLANFCMLDFIKMPKRNKTLNEENGFLTPQQLAERQRREVSTQTKAISFHRTKRLFPDLVPQQRCTVNADIDMEKD